MLVGVSAAGRSRPRISEGGGCAERSRSRSDPVCTIDGSGGGTGRHKATGVAQPLATAAIRRTRAGREWPNHHCIWQGTYGPHGRPVKWTRLARLERRSLIGRCAPWHGRSMIDGRRRALPQLFQPIGEWPCARRIAGRPRANAPPSRRSRRSAALAPPAEAGPFGLRIVLRRGRDAERDAAASGFS